MAMRIFADAVFHLRQESKNSLYSLQGNGPPEAALGGRAEDFWERYRFRFPSTTLSSTLDDVEGMQTRRWGSVQYRNRVKEEDAKGGAI